jgi:hypothetical protein
MEVDGVQAGRDTRQVWGCGAGTVFVAWAELQHIQQVSLLQALHMLQLIDSVTYCTTGADSAQTVPQCAVPCCAVLCRVVLCHAVLFNT